MPSKHENGMMDLAIQESIKEVATKGTDGCSSNSLILAGFGWLGSKMHSHSRENRTRVDKVKETGIPIAGGGGLAIVIMEVINLLSGS
tara:strand:- start:263 stop:526 length:264 start_codon:yes stop_codon:yes gene_type:complete